jgi:hypothetical protein
MSILSLQELYYKVYLGDATLKRAAEMAGIKLPTFRNMYNAWAKRNGVQEK